MRISDSNLSRLKSTDLEDVGASSIIDWMDHPLFRQLFKVRNKKGVKSVKPMGNMLPPARDGGGFQVVWIIRFRFFFRLFSLPNHIRVNKSAFSHVIDALKKVHLSLSGGGEDGGATCYQLV